MPDAGLLPLARQCAELGLEVSIVPRLFESMNDRLELEHLGGMPLFGLRTVDPKGWQFAIKHVLDRVVAGALLLGLSPVMARGRAAAVRLTSPGPLLFRQRRVGRDGRAFELLKFRSMRVPDDERRAASARARARPRAAWRASTAARPSGASSGAPRWTSCPS